MSNPCHHKSPVNPNTPKNEARAQAVIDFIQNLDITIGDHVGRKFLLRDWQKEFIFDVFAPSRSDGRRIVRRAIFSLPRKQGKSELSAALILAFLVGPLSEPNGEVYSAANDKEQAAIVFKACVRMIEANPALGRYLQVLKGTKTIIVRPGLKLRGQGSVYRALSAESGTKHGLNPSFVLFDELSQAKNRELLDTLLTSQGARSEPLFMVISTQSHDPQHPLSEMIDDGLKPDDESVCCHLYSAPDDAEVLDEAAWFGSNPALGDFRDLDEFRTMANRAARLPSEEQSFRLLYFNQRVSPNASLIARADWQDCEGGADLVDNEEVYAGLDLSGRLDLTALVLTSAENGSRSVPFFWKPEELVDQHTKRDGLRYDLAVQKGDLLISPGRSIDPKVIALKIAELSQRYRIVALAYDRWRIDELLRAFDQIGFAAQQGDGDGLKIVPWGQGYGDMAPAVDAFEEAIVQGELRHDGNMVQTFCVMNAVTTGDASGNRKLNKEKARFRIDGAVALAMALGIKARDRKVVVVPTPFEDPEFRYFYG